MKIFLESYGCTLNKHDASIIKGFLSNHELTDFEICDLVIINTCAVKNKTENRMFTRIERSLSAGKKVIVTGCLPAVNPERLSKYPVQSVDCNSLECIPKAVESGKSYYSEKHKNKLKMPSLQEGSTAVVALSEGCLGACAFCGTKNARGNLTSYPPEDIEKRVKELVKQGKKTIQLASQDNGCYGFDLGTDVVELLERIIAIPGDFNVRVGMMNPCYVSSFLDRLIEVYRSEKIIKFIHLPIQSGSDIILKKMNRKGKVSDFEKAVKKFKEEIPGIFIATDVIVGFPGESEEDFRKTIQLIERTKPEKVNVSMFYPRPCTKASLMSKIPTQILSERSKKMSLLCEKKN